MRGKKQNGKLKMRLTFSWRDLAVTVGTFALTSLLCAGLKLVSDTDFHVPLLFVLAVLVVSLTTDGYLWGMLASVVAVLGVNYVFTYPYFHMNFSIAGYPLTFLSMFAVSVITCTLTARAREGEKARLEGEREKMRANLLRAISHDFRTPLTGIIGAVNAVQENGDGLTDAEKAGLLNDARSEAEWLINMVENLLSITRIGGAEESALHKEPQLVEEVVWEAATRFRRQYPDMPVEIRIPEEMLLVEMDAILIEQVIINLLINAAIHGETATKAVLSVSEKDGQAAFCVEDDGVGFRDETLAHLPDGAGLPSDCRAEDSTRGMGIGLSVCSTIVRAHGGELQAENIRGGGARMSFRLPVWAGNPQEGTDNGSETEDPDR